MKRIICLFLCLAALSACTADKAEFKDTSETAPSSLQAQTQLTTSITTEATSFTEEELILTPIAGNKPLEMFECKIISDFWVDSEDEFLNKEHLQTAKALCYSDKEIKDEIDKYNKENVDIPIALFVKSADDISFNGGGTYDFDLDGKNESLLCLSYTPGWAMGGHAFIYIDEASSCILIKDSGCSAFAEVLDFKEFRYVSIHSYAGASSYFNNIYNFKNGIEFAIPENCSSRNISYENGIFMCQYKWEGEFPFICCSDGVFRQLAIEQITTEDFELHVENGKKYLEKLKTEGIEITEIYTCGYLKYWLCGNNYEEYFNISEDNGKWHSPSKNINITDEQIYGGDLWNIELIPYNNSK